MNQLKAPDQDAGAQFAPCPMCKQHSHSIGEDQLAAAFRHFQSMYSHLLGGHPMGYNFDEQTRDAAQVLMAAARPPIPDLSGDVERELSLDQRASRIFYNGHDDWWNALTDHQRRMLNAGSISMSETAFLAGVKAALQSNSNEGESDA